MQLPKMKQYKLYEPIPDVPGTNFDFKGTYTPPGEEEPVNVTVFDTDYFVKGIVNLYRNRRIDLPEENTESYFKALFDTWRASRADLYIKQAYAYTLKYDPLSDYDLQEQLIGDVTTHAKDSSDTKVITPFASEETTITPYAKETTTTTPYTSETTTEKVSAFNSSGFSDSSQSVYAKDGTEKVELQKTGTEKHKLVKEGTQQDKITYAGTDTDTRNYTKNKHGYTGWHMIPEIMKAEYDNLMQDLAARALSEFIERYTYYCEEVG